MKGNVTDDLSCGGDAGVAVAGTRERFRKTTTPHRKSSSFEATAATAATHNEINRLRRSRSSICSAATEADTNLSESRQRRCAGQGVLERGGRCRRSRCGFSNLDALKILRRSEDNDSRRAQSHSWSKRARLGVEPSSERYRWVALRPNHCLSYLHIHVYG
jgi:hypothetical protein